MQKKRKMDTIKLVAAKLPRRPKTLPLHEAARRTATIRANNVQRHKAHAEALALSDQIRQAELHNNLRMQRDQLLGASVHGRLRPEAHNRLRELMAILPQK